MLSFSSITFLLLASDLRERDMRTEMDTVEDDGRVRTGLSSFQHLINLQSKLNISWPRQFVCFCMPFSFNCFESSVRYMDISWIIPTQAVLFFFVPIFSFSDLCISTCHLLRSSASTVFYLLDCTVFSFSHKSIVTCYI